MSAPKILTKEIAEQFLKGTTDLGGYTSIDDSAAHGGIPEANGV